MTLDERCEYWIDMALRLSIIKKIHLKFDQNLTFEQQIS
jgi:hypothetical protein